MFRVATAVIFRSIIRQNEFDRTSAEFLHLNLFKWSCTKSRFKVRDYQHLIFSLINAVKVQNDDVW